MSDGQPSLPLVDCDFKMKKADSMPLHTTQSIIPFRDMQRVIAYYDSTRHFPSHQDTMLRIIILRIASSCEIIKIGLSNTTIVPHLSADETG